MSGRQMDMGGSSELKTDARVKKAMEAVLKMTDE